jgi:hypothetical protein
MAFEDDILARFGGDFEYLVNNVMMQHWVIHKPTRWKVLIPSWQRQSHDDLHVAVVMTVLEMIRAIDGTPS